MQVRLTYLRICLCSKKIGDAACRILLDLLVDRQLDNLLHSSIQQILLLLHNSERRKSRDDGYIWLIGG